MNSSFGWCAGPAMRKASISGGATNNVVMGYCV